MRNTLWVREEVVISSVKYKNPAKVPEQTLATHEVEKALKKTSEVP
jgi:hypothetical protein